MEKSQRDLKSREIMAKMLFMLALAAGITLPALILTLINHFKYYK